MRQFVVSLSVCNVQVRDHIDWNTSKIILRPNSLRHLLTLTQHGRPGATGTPQN